MSHAELENALARLRVELDALGPEAGAARVALGSLIAEIESELKHLEQDDRAASLGERVRRQLERFEIEHPRITGILNEVMVTLSNIGI